MGAPVFRREAVEHRFQGAQARAELLAVDPSATAWGARMLVAALLVCVAFLVFGELTEFASGPAVLRSHGRLRLAARETLQVEGVEVMPGDRVHAGDVLVRFVSTQEQASLDAVSRQLSDQLRKLLQRPDDATAREALVSLRAQRDLAQKRVQERTLRAPTDGLVGDVRVRSGDVVQPGLSVVELIEGGSHATVTALLPGRYRPFLHEGMRLRFEVPGLHERVQALEVIRVGDQVVGPAEASRYLGREVADAMPVNGPVVLVQAELPSVTIEVDDQDLMLAEGMFGKAEVPVRSEPIAYAFVPALKQWVARVHPQTWFANVQHEELK